MANLNTTGTTKVFLITELSSEFDETCLPLCLTDNPENYGFGYEVYETLKDGTFKLIKDWYEAREEGFSLCCWDNSEVAEKEPPVILKKFLNKGRRDFSKADVSAIKGEAGFKAEVKFILSEIQSCGEYAEETEDGKWVVFGEYRDDNFSVGY